MNYKIATTLKVLVTLIVSFLSLLAVVISAKFFGFDIKTIKNPATALNFSSIVIVLCILLVPILITYLSEKYLHQNSNFVKDYFHLTRWNSVLVFCVIGFFLKMSATLTAYLLSQEASVNFAFAGADYSWALYFLWFWIALVLNSINEELIYRAYPLKKLIFENKINSVVVIILTALVFSLMHFLIEEPDLGRFGYRTSFGLFAGILFFKNRSLWDIIGLHTGWNFSALSFSGDTDWRNGGLVNTIGVIDSKEITFNVVFLLGAFLFVFLRNKSVSK